MTIEKTNKMRKLGLILAFVEFAARYKDAEKVLAAAKRNKYKDSTAADQVRRLRRGGFLPAKAAMKNAA